MPRTSYLTSAIAKDKAQADQINDQLVTIAKTANSDAERGTLTYRVTRSTDDGLTFVIFEEYESVAAFEAHKAGPDFQRLLPLTQDLQKFDFQFFSQVYP